MFSGWFDWFGLNECKYMFQSGRSCSEGEFGNNCAIQSQSEANSRVRRVRHYIIIVKLQFDYLLGKKSTKGVK